MSKTTTVQPLHKRKNRLAQAISQGRNLALTGILASSLLSGQAFAEQARQYQLDPGKLGVTLTNFAAQSGVVIYFDANLTAGLSTQGLNGNYTVDAALQQLLDGTTLQVKQEADGSYRVIGTASASKNVLDTVVVNGQQLGNITEGTGSYTTAEMATATRLGMSVRETPQSVTVITQQRIKDQALSSITDVVNNTIGVTAKAFDSSRSGFSARGFDITNIMIDGVPTSWTSAWSAGETLSDTAIYDRVEVVKGSTGLVTGAGNPSAAINLVRKHANATETEAEVSLGVGSWDRLQGSIDVSTPLDDEAKVRTRFIASFSDADSFTDYLEEEKSVLYGVLDADLSDNTKFSTGISYQDNEPKGSMWGGLPSWFADGTRTNWDRSKNTGADWTHWASTSTNWFANLEHQFENGIKLHTAYSRTQSTADMELLFLFGLPDQTTGLGMGSYPRKFDVSRVQDNLDVYASIPFNAFERSHEAVVGMMYNNQDFEAKTASALTAVDVGNFYAWDGSVAEPTWSSFSVSDSYDTKQLGAYGALRLNLTDAAKLIIGTRVTNWERQGSSYGTPVDFEANGEVTSYIGGTYDINETYTAYASYTDIFQPQDAQDRNGNFLDPVEGGSYETGIKAEFMNGRLNLTSAVFRIEQDNLAQPDTGFFVPGTATVASYAAEGTTSQGFEFEVSGQLSENWEINFGYTQFDAEDVNGADVNTRHPRKTAKLFTTYAQGAWTYGGGINWQSESYVNATNPGTGAAEKLAQSSYTVVDAMVRYQFDDQLSAQLNVKNLFDKTYYDNVGFFNQYSYGAPRSFMLSLNYSF